MQITKSKKIIKVEGFKLEKLLSLCAKDNIYLEDISFQNDMEFVATIDGEDLIYFKKIIKSQYRLTVLSEKGFTPLIKNILSKRSMVIGIIIFLIFIYLQGRFISEIRIEGYEKNSEASIRQVLREVSIYEGALKNFDANGVKNYLYTELENISWVGLDMDGNLLKVSIIEMDGITSKVSTTEPCNIVASKYGIVEKIIAKNGFSAVTAGSILLPGEVGISGVRELNSTNYEKKDDSNVRYIHSDGEIIARVPYRYSFYMDKYELLKTPTGKNFYGLDIEIGNFRLNTVEVFSNWESWVYKEKEIIDLNSPFRLKLSLAKGEEVTLWKKELNKKALEKKANTILRGEMRKNLPKNAQILNKSLKFEPKINIIEVGALIEARENIGIEEEILIGEPAN